MRFDQLEPAREEAGVQGEFEGFVQALHASYSASADEPYETFAEAFRDVMAAQAVEITRLVFSNPVAIAGIRAHREPLPWKPCSIRAARRDRGRMRGAMLAAARRRWA